MSDLPNTYDVFVSYSHKDSDWVNNYLMPILNRGVRRFLIYKSATSYHSNIIYLFSPWAIGSFLAAKTLTACCRECKRT